MTASFNDSTWSSGGGLLFVESAALATNKTTVLTLGQSAYYFRRKVTIPTLTAGVSVQFRVMLDDGYVLWVNGRKAHFIGMDDVVVTHETFANRTVGDAAIEGRSLCLLGFSSPARTPSRSSSIKPMPAAPISYSA